MLAKPTIKETTTSLGGSPATRDGVTLFVFNPPSAYATTGTLIFNGLKGAEEAGITQASDLAHNVLVWEHLKDFYTRAEGEEVHVLFVAEACTFTNLFTSSSANNIMLRNYLASQEGNIKLLGVSLKPATETNTGLSADLVTAIPLAQVVRDNEFSKSRPLDIILEGRKLTSTASAMQNLRALASGNVSVVAGRDATRKAELVTLGNTGANNYAALGLVLGTLASIHVGRSIGRVKNAPFNIVPEFSGGQRPLGTASIDFGDDDLDTLDTKGLIFFRKIPNKAGVYLNNDHTCTAKNLSKAFIRYNRTLGKVARIALATYTEEILDEFPVNPDTTGLFPQDITRIERGIVEAIENEMLNNPTPGRVREISTVRAVLADTAGIFTSRKLSVRVIATPLGVAEEIETTLELGF